VAATAGTLLVSLAAGTERSGRRQPAVEAMTACTALTTAARLASADTARLCVQFYKTPSPGCTFCYSQKRYYTLRGEAPLARGPLQTLFAPANTIFWIRHCIKPEVCRRCIALWTIERFMMILQITSLLPRHAGTTIYDAAATR